MTNNGWGDKWPNGSGWPTGFDNAADEAMSKASGVPWSNTPVLNWLSPTALDLAIGEHTVLTTFEAGEVKHKVISQTELKSQGSNLVDIEGYLYLQCEKCNTLLNPHTKSFKTLQEKRVSTGWKCVWSDNGVGYKVYCGECKL